MNQSPIITPDIFDPIEQDSGFHIFNITGNDIDPEGNAIVIQNTGNPTGGSWAILSGTGNTSLEFTPAPGFTGIASIDYTIIDADGGTAQGTFQIEVLPLDPYAGFERGTEGRDVLFGSLFASNETFGAGGNDLIFGGFKNDHLAGGTGRDKLFGGFGDDILDGNEGNDKLFGGFGDDSLNGGAGHDRLFGGIGNDVLNGGAGRDHLNGGFGLDTAIYEGSVLDYEITMGRHWWSTVRISDGSDTDRLRQIEQVEFDDALVFLDGRNNVAFVQDDDAGTTGENDQLVIDAATLLANDVDFDGDVLTLTGVSATSVNGASVTLVDGEITYDPGTVFDNLDDGETAIDSFTYIVDDGRGGMATATATVMIEGETDNTAPVALDQVIATDEDAGIIDIDLNALISDADAGDVLNILVPTVSGGFPASFVVNDGIVSVDTDQFNFLGVGESNFFTLEYGAEDGAGGSDTGSVTVNIEGRNDAPVFTNPTIATNEDAGVIFFDLNPFISDVDTNDMVRVGAFSPAPGTFVSASLSDGVVRLDTAQFDSMAAGETFSGAIDVEIVDDSGAPNNIGVGQVFLTVEGRDEVSAALSVAPDDGFDSLF